jgi:hypothetical protein
MTVEQKNDQRSGIENSHCVELKNPMKQYLFIETI